MDSLPPPPLRLLPAGTTSCRVGITPTENPNLTQRTPRRGVTHSSKRLHLESISTQEPYSLFESRRQRRRLTVVSFRFQ